MSYIVIFNTSCKDAEILTNDHGFVQHFGGIKHAKEEADNWLDGKDYRDYQIYEEVEN